MTDLSREQRLRAIEDALGRLVRERRYEARDCAEEILSALERAQIDAGCWPTRRTIDTVWQSDHPGTIPAYGSPFVNALREGMLADPIVQAAIKLAGAIRNPIGPKEHELLLGAVYAAVRDAGLLSR